MATITEPRIHQPIAVVEGGSCRDEYIGHTLQGNVQQVLAQRTKISIEQILEPVEGQPKLRLVLMEGAPGIGKSTLAWELCRKWEEFSCMKQYSLVVLLRLREKIVQKISRVSELFCKYENEGKTSLVEEVSKSQGNGVLFVLDGFDELPKILQKEGFLLDLMKGSVLPASTVLVTSRPSATAELLTSCRPQIQKHIEILGFTQENVKVYASSVFSSEPDTLERFKAYISASNNPAINSLMYIPLNAAIIVEIYRNCKSDDFLPHTLTELYTQLCLTILNRHLKIHHPSIEGIEKFDDLPDDLYQQFLHLSQVAYNGIKSVEVIFHTSLHSLGLGFLDAVSALYGGGKVSYNFLHLTLQEFFAAYHISHLGSSGLEVFKQHGKDERWNVVWRFVAGLTKFEHYKGHIDSDLFIVSRGSSVFTIQCLFEAQSIDAFSSVFKTITSAKSLRVDACNDSTALDVYALGFCVSNFQLQASSLSWSVKIYKSWKPFICGIKSKTDVPHLGGLYACSCSINTGELKVLESFPNLYYLSFSDCNLNNANLIYLSEVIQHNVIKNLSEFRISTNYIDHQGDGMLKILQQLSQSKVTSLTFIDVGISKMLRDSPHVYSSALKRLLCPLSGKVTSLRIGDESSFYFDDNNYGGLASIVSASSSLKYLELYNTDLSRHVSYLKVNNNLTGFRLTLYYYEHENWQGQVTHIAEIIKYNKTLKNLELNQFNIHNIDNIAALKMINNALPENKTLQTIELHTYVGSRGGEVSSYIMTRHKELTLDSRIKLL